MQRCHWCNLQNPLYVTYHDKEWGNPCFDEQYLFEMLILESFQAGLSWECVLNKRENFRKAFDDFNIEKIVKYDNNRINELLLNNHIIKNKLKIKASINNAIVFKSIEEECGSFYNYLNSYFHNEIIYEINKTTNKLSDAISNDLKKRGMKFVGSTIIYAYLQAVGFIYSHEKQCYLYKKKGD